MPVGWLWLLLLEVRRFESWQEEDVDIIVRVEDLLGLDESVEEINRDELEFIFCEMLLNVKKLINVEKKN